MSGLDGHTVNLPGPVTVGEPVVADPVSPPSARQEAIQAISAELHMLEDSLEDYATKAEFLLDLLAPFHARLAVESGGLVPAGKTLLYADAEGSEVVPVFRVAVPPAPEVKPPTDVPEAVTDLLAGLVQSVADAKAERARRRAAGVPQEGTDRP